MEALTADLRLQFEEEGWLMVEGVLDPARDLAPIMAEYAEILDRLVDHLHAAGRLVDRYGELPFAQRLIQISLDTGATYGRHFDITLPGANVAPDTPCHFGPAVFRLLTQPRLLDVIEDLLGPEIYSNPVQHVRLKLPRRALDRIGGPEDSLVGAAPWHQDNGVVLPEADETEMLTVWLPLGNATVENGCLQLIPRSHRRGLLTHCPGDGLHIPDHLLPGAPLPVPVPVGGVLLMHRRTAHASLDNVSDGIRWSFDLRYQPTGQPTGRDYLPGFVARSRARPETALRDADEWRRRWEETRAALVGRAPRVSNRWAGDDPACA
jgi:hypothetical protein